MLSIGKETQLSKRIITNVYKGSRGQGEGETFILEKASTGSILALGGLRARRAAAGTTALTGHCSGPCSRSFVCINARACVSLTVTSPCAQGQGGLRRNQGCDQAVWFPSSCPLPLRLTACPVQRSRGAGLLRGHEHEVTLGTLVFSPWV